MRDRDRGILIMLFGVIAITPDSLLVRLMQLEGGSTVDQNLQSIFWKYLLTVPLMSGFSVRHSGGVLKLLQRLKRNEHLRLATHRRRRAVPGLALHLAQPGVR